MKNKKVILVVGMLVIILVSTSVYFFGKNNYKTTKLGNTITNLNTEGITEYILNLSSYEAKVNIEVTSNKNTNKYVMKQQYAEPNIFKQEVEEPTNIAGLTTMYNGSTLTIQNTKLKLNEIYDNYQYMLENNLCLKTFIQNYKASSNSKVKEENAQIIMETKVENSKNKYAVYQKLFIDKKTAKPIKLEIQDINQKMLVYILYNEIKINSTNKEEILAFVTNINKENI